MRRHPAVPPPGSTTTAWPTVNNRASRLAPQNRGRWDEADAEVLREGRTVVRPQRVPAARRGGRCGSRGPGQQLAGFCWTRVHAEHDPPLGEIYVIAVDPDFKGRGLGRAVWCSAGPGPPGGRSGSRWACCTWTPATVRRQSSCTSTWASTSTTSTGPTWATSSPSAGPQCGPPEYPDRPPRADRERARSLRPLHRPVGQPPGR